MYLPRSRSAMSKRCLFLVLCVLLAGHATVERLSGQVVTGQVIDSTPSVTIVVSYRAGMTNQSRRACATLTARSGDIRQSIPAKDTVSVYVLPWHPKGIVFHWEVRPRSNLGGCPAGGGRAVGWAPVMSGSIDISGYGRDRGVCRGRPSRLPWAVERRSSVPVYIEPGHEFLLQCP